MKKKTFIVILVVLWAIFALAFAQTRPSSQQRPLMPVRINPALVGIEQLHVVIIPYDIELADYFQIWDKLKFDVEQKLIRAGLRRTPLLMRDFSARTLDYPELLVEINLYEIPNLPTALFRVQTSIVTGIGFRRNPPQFIRTEVFSTATMLEVPSPANMAPMITNLVSEQLDVFIRAWMTANQRIRRPADANDVSPPPATGPKKKSTPITKPATKEYNYIASVKSKVFHKSDCNFAKRIKPQNLMTFTTRTEAIKTGRRPCSVCKP